jgi:uncharacterized membrane-anchored protein
LDDSLEHVALCPSAYQRADPELKKRANAFIRNKVQPYQRANIESLRLSAPYAEIEVHSGTDHYFFQDDNYRDWTIKRMRHFLVRR